ncbi:MAG TPA: hypothetical protein PKA63_00990 [Oligoflexia bacterium]|nr:hypothetical protein [Oligoflexia bacterium]HMP47224.1 hypothetical protein [Oligoflexia bacterium]
MSIRLYSDGGADSQKRSAAACIIEGVEGSRALSLVSYLGAATNNEAEIFSSLMGFSIIHIINARKGQEVVWVSDSEYCLKSATQYMNSWVRNGWKTSQKEPVKNQGLWKSFNTMTSQIRILPEHVRGHTGHKQNEACDSAVGWARENHKIFDSDSFTPQLMEIEFEGYRPWCVIDGRDLLSEIRDASDKGLEIDTLKAFFLTLYSLCSGGSGIDNFVNREATGDIRNIKSTLKGDLPQLKKLTRAYLKKLDELSEVDKVDLAKISPDVMPAINLLRRWSSV